MSLPGSCNFYGLKCGESKSWGEPNSIRLSGFNFELGYYDFLEGSSLAPQELPIDTVVSWYKRLGLGVKQKSETGVEKAIFSLLHLCKKDTDVSSVVWIFHALEAIYGTRVGEGFTNIVDRISLLLELDPREKKRLKKSLRELYDYRSSFVHGGYKVHHPMSMEIIDARLSDDYSKLYDLVRSGFNIVVASLQVLIKNDWFGIRVDESLSGLRSID
nr:HEPN domain-containing protein [Pseudomonas costantinii]